MATFYEPITRTTHVAQFENEKLTVVQQMAKEERQRQYEQLEETADNYLVDLLLQQTGNVKQNVFHGGFVSELRMQIQEQPDEEKRQQCKWVLRDLKGIYKNDNGEYFGHRDKQADSNMKFKYRSVYNELQKIKALSNAHEPLKLIELIKEMQLEQQ